MMGTMILLYFALIVGTMFFDFLLELDMPLILYVIGTGVFVGWAAANIHMDAVIPETPIAITQDIKTIQDDTKRELNAIKADVKADMSKLRPDVKADISEVVEQTTDSDDSSSVNTGFVLVTCVIFVVVWIFTESLFVGIFVAFMFFSFVGDNISVTSSTSTKSEDAVQTLKQVNTKGRRFKTEYLSNRIRSKTPIYLFKGDDGQIATSDPSLKDEAPIIFKPIKLVTHSSGMLYACKDSKQCYPVGQYE